MDGGSKINLARFRDKYFGEKERERKRSFSRKLNRIYIRKSA